MELEQCSPRYAGKCHVCGTAVYEDNYQHVHGMYFCGSSSDCLTNYLGSYYQQETGGPSEPKLSQVEQES